MSNKATGCYPGIGGYSHVCFLRRLGPSINRSPPKNNRNFKHSKKNTWNYAPWPQEKTLKFIEVTLKYSPVLWWPPKISTQFSYKKIFVFLKTPKNIEIQILSQKMTEPTYVWKYERPPPPCCYYMHFYCFVQIQRIIIKQPPVFFCHTRIWQNHIIFLVVQKTQNH